MLILHALRVPAQQRSKHVSGYHPRGEHNGNEKEEGRRRARKRSLRAAMLQNAMLTFLGKVERYYHLPFAIDLLPPPLCCLPFHSERSSGEEVCTTVCRNHFLELWKNNYYTSSINETRVRMLIEFTLALRLSKDVED